jgi:hypothetical protein
MYVQPQRPQRQLMYLLTDNMVTMNYNSYLSIPRCNNSLYAINGIYLIFSTCIYFVSWKHLSVVSQVKKTVLKLCYKICCSKVVTHGSVCLIRKPLPTWEFIYESSGEYNSNVPFNFFFTSHQVPHLFYSTVIKLELSSLTFHKHLHHNTINTFSTLLLVY